MTIDVLVFGGSGFIGTNLISELMCHRIKVHNFDLNPPLDRRQNDLWIQGDILNLANVSDVIHKFKPTYIVDLIARTDVDETQSVEEGYSLNYNGVLNILSVISEIKFLERVIFTSTQYVKKPGSDYMDILNYAPHTTYGESKVRMEKIIFDSNIACDWLIIRPTNVWGPWHFRYLSQFFKVLRAGLYFHPGGAQAIKSYAYVGNVAEQIRKLLYVELSDDKRKIFYVGDATISILDWVNAMSLAFRRRKVTVIPRGLFRSLVFFGDLVSSALGRPFLINSSRYKSIIEDYPTDTNYTLSVLGENKYSLEQGVSATLSWIQQVEENSDQIEITDK
jgi:nucleoside-diphosphate-sugar epimerase